MDRQSEPPDPRKVRSGSDRGKRRIPLLGYEDELVPRGGPAIQSLQKEGKGIEICRQREHSHTRYSPRNPLRSLQPPRKLTSRKLSIRTVAVDLIYPAHANTLRKARLAPSAFPTMGYLWEKQDEKLEKNKELNVSVKKNRNIYFCVAYSRNFLRQSTG